MGRDLAIDLGTANTLVYRQGDGIVFDEPTVVALHARHGDVVAIGDDGAGASIGGDSGNVVAMRPLREGTITEFEVTQRFLEAVLRRVGAGTVPEAARPDLHPVGQLARSSGGRSRRRSTFSGGKQVTLVEEPLAAAIGAGLPIHEPIGHLIVDIGGARSEMAVVSMGGVVSGRRRALGGFDLDAAIQEHVRATCTASRSARRPAEEIKLAIGSAFPSASGRAALVVGRELAEREHGRGASSTRTRSARRWRSRSAGSWTPRAGRSAEAPPELTHDVLETGMFLTGGGSLLKGLDLLLAQECEVPVHVAEKPARDRRDRRGAHARAPRGLPFGVPAGPAGVSVTTSAEGVGDDVLDRGVRPRERRPRASPSPRSSRASAPSCRGRGPASAPSPRRRGRTRTSARTGSALMAGGMPAAAGARRACSRPTTAARSARSGFVDAPAGPRRSPGAGCVDWAGGVTGDGFAAQGNILAGEGVVARWRARSARPTAISAIGSSPRCSRATPPAATGAGGNRPPCWSCATGGGYEGRNDRYIDLRVDDHPDAPAELARLFAVWDDTMLVRTDPPLEATAELVREVQRRLAVSDATTGRRTVRSTSRPGSRWRIGPVGTTWRDVCATTTASRGTW